MTIVDVALHKWRMLDDRRRRIIVGSTILVILLTTLVIYLAASKAKDTPEPQPDPTPTTTSTTTTTTSTTTTTTTESPVPHPPNLIASKDGRALAELSGSFVFGEDSGTHTLELPRLAAIEVETEGKPEDKRFKVNLKLAADNLEISCNFLKTDKAIEADQIMLTWTHAGETQKQCQLHRRSETENFFHSNSASHYKCSMKKTYDCTGNSSIETHLIIDNIELEFDRQKPVDLEDLKFETPAFECPK